MSAAVDGGGNDQRRSVAALPPDFRGGVEPLDGKPRTFARLGGSDGGGSDGRFQRVEVRIRGIV